jgi:hypothetical protein
MVRIVLFTFVLCLAGCGGSTTNTVSGSVTFKGAEVPTGTVTFVPKEGPVVQGQIQDGHYEVTGVALGEAVITVVRVDANVKDPSEALNELRKLANEKGVTDDEGLRKLDTLGIMQPGVMEEMRRRRFLLPQFYSDTTTSDLRYTVQTGMNTYNIVMEEK